MGDSVSLMDFASGNIAGMRAELERRIRLTPAMTHSIDMQGHLIAVSDAWLVRLGYKNDDVIGKPSSNFLTPESRRHAIRNVLPQFFLNGRCENVEYQMVCKDGHIIDILLSAILDKSADGLQFTSLAVITDVTSIKAAERQLAESEARYKGLVEDQTEMVSLATPEGDLLFVNAAYARFYHMKPADMVGKSLLDLVPVEHRTAVATHLHAVCKTNESIESENQICQPNGRTRWIAWTNRALRGAKAHSTLIHSVGRDIDRRVVAEHQLKVNEARYRILAEHSTDMVFQLDLGFVRTYVSPACHEMLGFAPEELVGSKPSSMLHPEDVETERDILRSLVDGSADRATAINRIRHRDGRWIWVEANFRTIKHSETDMAIGIIGSSRDISVRKAVEEQLAEATRRLEVLAGQDGLTGLANRRAFDENMLLECRRVKRADNTLTLMMIDVDWFKSFNDHYGHPAGDECLKQVGQIIEDTVCRRGDLVARYGGEEFAVILPNTDEALGLTVGESIRQAIFEAGIVHDGSPIRKVTISLGLASLNRKEIDGNPKLLLFHADAALYRAKSLGFVDKVFQPQAA